MHASIAALSARVSDAEDGYGLDVQEQAIRTWAKANHHKVVTVLADDGISGAKELDYRPALADALDLVRDGAVEAIAVYKLDRLACDLVLQEQLLAEIRRLGGDLRGIADALAAEGHTPKRGGAWHPNTVARVLGRAS